MERVADGDELMGPVAEAKVANPATAWNIDFGDTSRFCVAIATVDIDANSRPPIKSLLPPSGGSALEDPREVGILDLTGSQLHTLKDVDLPASLVELDLTSNRLTEVNERIGQMSSLKKLSLRQNLFEDSAVEVFNKWPAVCGLQELILRDNKLTLIPLVSALSTLVVLDVSSNKIESMTGLSKISSTLQEVYLSSNAIQRIEELDHLHELRILELELNKVRTMHGIQKLTQLKELWLGRNRLTTVNMFGLTNLTRISVRSNHLTSMLGFEACVLLEELYLSHNNITDMEGLSTLTKLRILDVSSNKLETIKDIKNLRRLDILWFNDNNVPTLEGIQAALEGVRTSLAVVYLERNPCCRNNPDYVSKLRTMLPKLVQINSQFFV